jgi:hypothetical protein
METLEMYTRESTYMYPSGATGSCADAAGAKRKIAAKEITRVSIKLVFIFIFTKGQSKVCH